MFIECDKCKQSFSEEDVYLSGADSLCKWCKMKLDKKHYEDESKLTYRHYAEKRQPSSEVAMNRH